MSGRDCSANDRTTLRTEPQRQWPRAALWFSGLAPFFFLSYGIANLLAANKTGVNSIVYAWEHHIPFLSWTIIPYWSIDLFYAASLFVCRTGTEIDTLGKRLLSVQIIAVLCFIVFPLSFSFERPEISGLPGALFAMLDGFDQPFNQAPSLHIALLVVLWAHFVKHVPSRLHRLFHTWFALIGVSVLTTYQHHFIDIPTGALLGLFCLWLWPEDGRHAVVDFHFTHDRHRQRIAFTYVLMSAALAAFAAVQGGVYLWTFWPAVSLLLVAAAYAGLGVALFQKNALGRMSLGARLLLAPYLAGARFNSRLWTLFHPHPVHIRDDVWIGRFPSAFDLARGDFATVVDLTAEMSAPRHGAHWLTFPSLDLVTPEARLLRNAAYAIERSRHSGPVLVCCALGYSRSAQAIASWLFISKRSATVRNAIAQVRAARPQCRLTDLAAYSATDATRS